MKTKHSMLLAEPQIISSPELKIAGLRGHFTRHTRDEIALQWQRFIAELERSRPTRVGAVAYGVCYCSTDEAGFEYLSGIAVSDFNNVPESWHHVTLPPQSYAVFRHEGHVSEIADAAAEISKHWTPPPGYDCVHGNQAAPDFFERYGEHFNPQTGFGDIEIWVPVCRKQK